LGKNDEGALAPQLNRLHELSLQSGNCYGLYHANLIEAWLADKKGDLTVCHTRLREAFNIGRDNQLYQYLGAQPRLLAYLCAEALAAEIETDYVRELIRQQRLEPPQAMRLDDGWPWPVKIHTLGDFAVQVNGKPMASGRKSPRRQLEVLQVLIAQNGEDVSLESLADTLWPDAEGDAALHALETTLYRLRQLIGLDVIRVQAGRISLDPRLCWVDAYALTQLTKQIETGLATQRDSSMGELGERLLGLYRGEFLGGNDSPWAIAPRQRLNSAFRRAMTALAEHYRRHGETSVAQHLLLRATKHAAGITRERRQTMQLTNASVPT
jgi:LuxR family maltose regulon positive regulatory protein